MTTKLYFQNQAAVYLPATKRGGWTTSTSTTNRQMGTTKFSTKTFSSIAAAAGGSTLYCRFVSTPFLQGGLIPTTATLNTMFGQLSASGVYNLQAHIFVTAGDTDTVRGTLLTKQSVNSTNTITTEVGRGMTNIAMADGITVVAGDRLVMEIGFNYISGTAGSPRVYYGGTAGDLTEGSTSTTLTGWIELSTDWDFVFVQPPPPSPAVAIYPDNNTWDVVTATHTATVTCAANDLLILYSATEESNVGYGSLPTGNSLTYTERADIGAASSGEVALWTAPCPGAAAAWSCSLAGRTSGVDKWGFDVLRVSNGTPGAVVQGANAVDNEPNISLTTTQDGSGIVVVLVDWNAVDGLSRVWKTVNGFTPTAANSGELRYFRNPVDMAAYAAWYPNVGTAGAKLVGLNTLAVGGFSIAAIEVKQPGSGPPKLAAPRALVFDQIAAQRAANW